MIRRAFTMIEAIVLLSLMAVLAALIAAGVLKVRNAADQVQCLNNLRQIGLALSQYHDFHHVLPPGISHPHLPPYGTTIDPYPMLSWHGRLLSFVDQESLWKQTTEAYAQDSKYIDVPPHVGIVTAIAIYICPADTLAARDPHGQHPLVTPATTSYLGVSGTNQFELDGLLYTNSHVRFAGISDGQSNTLMAGERPPSSDLIYGRWYGGWGHWGVTNSYLGVRDIDVDETLTGCYGPFHFHRPIASDSCARWNYWSFHSGGANFLFADASARFIGYSADQMLPSLATRAGGEIATGFD